MRNCGRTPAWARLLALCVILTGSLAAHGAEFVPGDLYLLSHALPAPGGLSLYGIVRVEPLSGATTLLYAAPATLRSSFTYDPYRQLLVFVDDLGRILGVDADGVVSVLLTPPSSPQTLAARGDGIIYMQVGAVFHYLDAANVQHPLLDEAGTGTYNFLPGGTLSEMRYHAGTNSLITVSAGALIPACVQTLQICAGRIPLTAAGTQVAGPMAAAQADVSGSGEQPVGSGERSDGKVLLVIDTNSNDQEPRMQLLDPVSMALSIFAANGSYTGAAAVSTGTYSNMRNQAVIDDSFHDELRAFSLGSVGDGVIFSTSASGYGVSSGGHSEYARIVEIVEPTATSAGPYTPGGMLEVEPPHPNPFGPQSSLRYRLTHPSHVRVEIYDVRGRLVRTVFDGERDAGWHDEAWDGVATGGPVSSGVYFVRVTTPLQTQQLRFVRIR